MKTIGAFIFPDVWSAWDRHIARQRLHELRAFGINTFVTESDTYRDDVIAWVHEAGMRFIGGIACFSEHAHGHHALHQRPELWPLLENGERRPQMEWYIGVTPTHEDYRMARLALLDQIVRDHALDGICLDFIRWPLHWELELRPQALSPLDSSFDPHTLRQFTAFAELELPPDLTTTAQQAHWILNHHRSVWTDFKCHIITSFVAQVAGHIRALRGDGFEIGVYLVPLFEDDRSRLVGQRARSLAPLVDFVAPMTYHTILHRPLEWVTSILEDAARFAPGKILPVLQVDSAEGAESGADWGPPMPPVEWEQAACAAARDDRWQGLIAFTGTSLFRDNRGQLLRRCLS